jgi:hypothetical protein
MYFIEHVLDIKGWRQYVLNKSEYVVYLADVVNI